LEGRLQSLNVRWMRRLCVLPVSMGRLTGLQTLDSRLELEGLDALEEVPASVGGLTGLKQLTISMCYALGTLPASIGRLTGLQTLVLEYLRALGEVPASVGGLTGLRKFMIIECYALGELPDSIGLLTGLLELCVRGTPMRDMPASMEALTALRRLTVGGCGDSSKAYKTLARCLPSMRLLQSLELYRGAETERMG